MARKSSFSDAFSQSFSASVDRFNRNRDQIEEEKRAEARRRSEIVDERLYREDQKYLDREHEAGVVRTADDVLNDRIALTNQRAIAKDLAVEFSKYGLDPGTFTKDDGTMYEYAAQRELMEAKKQGEAGTAAGYANSATPFVRVPGGAPDERFFRAMEKVGESQQVKDGEAKAVADTAQDIRLKPFFARASGRWNNETGDIPFQIPVGTPAEGLGYEKFFTEEDLKATAAIGSDANITESNNRFANEHSADMYKRIVESRNVPADVIDAITDPDPAKARAARVRALKQIELVPGSVDKNGVGTNDYYTYQETPPRLYRPDPANSGAGGIRLFPEAPTTPKPEGAPPQPSPPNAANQALEDKIDAMMFSQGVSGEQNAALRKILGAKVGDVSGDFVSAGMRTLQDSETEARLRLRSLTPWLIKPDLLQPQRGSLPLPPLSASQQVDSDNRQSLVDKKHLEYLRQESDLNRRLNQLKIYKDLLSPPRINRKFDNFTQ